MPTKLSAGSRLARNKEDVKNDEAYQHWICKLREQFYNMVSEYGTLYSTNAAGDALWERYLAAIEEPYRAENECYECRSFVRSYGALVCMLPTGALVSPVWDPDIAPEPMRAAVAALRDAVLKAKLLGVFASSNSELGHWHTNDFTHLSVAVPPSLVHNRADMTAWQAQAKYAADYRTLCGYLASADTSAIEGAALLLKSGSLPSSEKFTARVDWLLEAIRRFGKRGPERNLLWEMVAKAPAGWCEVRSSALGSLISDISSGLTGDSVAERWAAIVDPLKYQRAQEAPKAGTVRAAEDLVRKLGVEESLGRRYASVSDIKEWLWQTPQAWGEGKRAGVFGGIKTREDKLFQSKNSHKVAGSVLTFARFYRDVLPDAKSVTLKVPSIGPFMALTTALNFYAPPILKWDRAGDRNPVGWYFYANPTRASHWGLGATAKVLGVCKLPSMWGAGARAGLGSNKLMFVLEGAMDTGCKGLGGALFPEMLTDQLHSVRAVIEAYSNEHDLAPALEIPACGIALEDGAHIIVDVESSLGITTYTIDRLD